MKKIKSFSVSVALATLLIGCGGGGSSSVESTSGGSSSSLNASFQNALIAEPTIENATEVEETIVSNDVTSFNVLNSVNSNNKLSSAEITKTLFNTVSKDIATVNINNYSLNETVNETFSCSNSGSYSISGTGSETGPISLNITYNNCNESSIVLNGNLSLNTSGYVSSADNYTNMNISFSNNFSFVTNYLNFTIHSGSYINTTTSEFDSTYGLPSKYVIETTFISTLEGETYGVEDAIYNYDETSGNFSFYIEQGKFYANNMGIYVNYDESYDMSQTPFIYSSYGSFENGGEARFTMSNSGKMKIVIESNTVVSYVDANGDGTYEIIESIAD